MRKQQHPGSQTDVLKSSSSVLSADSAHLPNLSPGEDDQSSTPCPVPVEEIFDILPKHGCLQPGDQQLITFSFFSNESISREVIALCNVKDGPTYEIILKGETSEIRYSVESTRLDLGPQVFSCVGEADVTVKNTGKMGFDFKVIYLQSEEEEENNTDDKVPPDAPQQKERLDVRPGRPVVFPAVGHIEAGSEQDLRVLYLPGVPEVFEKHFQVQVDVLPPEEVTLTGVGVFPRVMLNLPRNLSDECYSHVMELAKTAMGANRVDGELTHRINAGGQTSCTLTDDELLQMEIERLLVKENAHVVSGNLLDLRDSHSSFSQWHKLSKFQLPEYVLNFGFAIPGKVFSESVNIINNGSVPVSFHANCKHLAGTGFTAEFESVKNLPCGETYTFTVTFNSQGANLKVGETNVLLPIKISGGPQVTVRLCAVVTMPTITASEDMLQFDAVQRGMCQMKTIQLLNQEPVPCHWSMAEEVKPFKKVNKFLPQYMRRKILQHHQPPAPVFEMMPCAGVLFPGERINVHIMFRPSEEGSYRKQLKVHVADSPQQQVITALGQCEEPQLEFCPSPLELGPCLPFDTEAEAEVKVKNPCSFPVEFYSLEFDTEYLTEEKILRVMPGYDEKNMLLLPPRVPGHGLPTELLEYYKDHSSQLEGDELNVKEDESKKDDTRKENEKSKGNRSLRVMSTFDVKPIKTIVSELTREANSGKLGELELTPVSRAIACHMGLDLSPERLITRSHSGLAIIVYGAPWIDTSSVAADLAGHYGAACLSVDAVVKDAIQNDQGTAGTTEPESPGSVPASLAPVDFQAEQSETNDRNKSSITHQDTEDTHNGFCELDAGEVPRVITPLSDHLLVDILKERFQQLGDCYRGVVIDDLKSRYTQNSSSTLRVVLKALNNHKHIYVVNLFDTYAALKTREKEQKESEETLQRERTMREEKLLLELNEETFDALPVEERERIIQKHVEELRKQKLRDLEEKAKNEEKLQQEKLRKKEDIKKKPRKSMMVAMNSNNSTTAGLVGTQEQQNVKEVSEQQSKEAEDSLVQPENNKLSGTNTPQPTDKLESEQCIVDELQCKFTEYEQSQVAVEHCLEHWDRVRGLLVVPLPCEEIPAGSSVVVKEKQAADANKRKKLKKMTPSPVHQIQAEADNQPRDTDSALHAIPHIVLNVTKTGCGSSTELLSTGTLPPLDEILNHLELGPSDPPIPLPITFSVVPFPNQRDQVMVQEHCFTFLNPSVLNKDEEKKDVEEKTEAKGKGHIGKQKASKKKSKLEESHPLLETSSIPDVKDQVHPQRHVEMKRSQSQTTFRWVVPPNGEVILKVWFYSELPGEFGQVFNFELAGTRKLYQLTCRGCCTYPSICNKYETLFTHSKKVQQGNDGFQRAYIISPGYFEFGPLLCSKMTDRYKEKRYPENSERMVIHNISRLEAEVQFSFQHDTKAATYLLDPPTMTLSPGQKQELTIWAYPTKQGQTKDSVVCHIKDNPEPVIINISCWGVTPKLDLESKTLHFGKTLVHRRESRSILMFNRTALPVAWRMLGVNELSDFVVPQVEGIISPHSSFPFHLYFMAQKRVVIKKSLHLEVSDVERTVGSVHTTNIQVTAETYDPLVEITPDTKLDFGTIKVFQEAKLSLKLSNHGPCKLAYEFKAEQGNPALPNPESIFLVSPQSNSLFCKETTTVHIVCRPDKEISINEEPILTCQLIEPSLGTNGETIDTLDILVSVQSVFSRYKITPASDLDFGPLVHGTKKTQSFTIENNGVLPTKFTISCMKIHSVLQARSGGLDKMIPRGATGLKVSQESVQREPTAQQNCLTMGVFSVFPCNGIVKPGSQQKVAVNCVAEQLGTWNQDLLIEISGRKPSDHPDGIPYRLRAEVWKPVIDLDMTSIFEEHFLCHNSSQLSFEQFSDAESIYVLDENKFIFNKVLVGKTAQARFKLTNSTKVPCGLNLAIKYVRAKPSQDMEVFDLPVTTLNIPRQSHAFAVVTFTPRAMQRYSAVFEATMDRHSRRTPTLSNMLRFDLVGEGTLPNVCVVRPALRNNAFSPEMHFGRVLVGRRHTLPLVLLNDGNIPAQVQIDMMDENCVFAIKAASGNTNISIHSTQPEDTDSGGQLVHRAVLTLDVNEQRRFEVGFCSDKPMSVKTNIEVQVKDNQYSNTMIQVTGEAYQEIVSLDIVRSPQEINQDEEKDNCEVLHFGDCQVDLIYQKRFAMINHSSSQVVRFEWPVSESQIIFSPQVGHLHAGCSKEVIVTFKSSQPVTLSRSMRCKICQVKFQQPQQQVADWDDQQRSVQYQSTSSLTASETSEQPVVNKVTKTDPEPACSVVEGSQLELDLLVTAVCDYVKFSCSINSLHFKDTMIFQTRIHQLQIVNVGEVTMEFSWEVFMDSTSSFDQRGETSTPRPGSSSTRWLPRSRPSSAFISAGRPSSALSSVMSLLVGNLELPPFSVEPTTGTIHPGTTQNFSIRFSPVEVTQYQGKLLCSIPNLQEGDQAPCIQVLGRSLLPYCHFDLEDSEYISDNRRCPEFTQSLDPNTRVLEFEAVGLFASTRRCFNVANPTSEAYSFRWRCADTGVMYFSCLQSSGTILPGKKVEMSFEYVAEHKDAVESSWSFVIETLSLSVPFLLVGTTREPVVYLNKPCLDFGDLIVGCKSHQTVDLVSVEEEPVHFSVLQSSLCSEDQQSRLILNPMKGTVASKNRLPLSVFFKPTSEGPVNFRLILKVKRKSEPLTMTVKADCFSVSTLVQVKSPEGNLREIIPNHQDTLDFGKVGISEQSSFNILVSNLSKFILEVNFELTGPREQLQHLKTKPPSATLEAGKQLLSSLLFSPQSICSLHGVTLNLKVKLGPTFVFSVKGRAEAPSLEFSFTEFNFGKCFLRCPGMVLPSRTLEIRNKGTQNVRVQSHFKNTAFLEMDFQSNVLFPGAAMEVPVTFCPDEARQYQEKITFILNSCITKHVDIQGQGIERKLEVKYPRQKKVRLGTLMVGQEVKKRVVLVNHSGLDLCFPLTLSTNTPMDTKDLSVSPAELTLKSYGGSGTAEIQFSPQQLVPSFSAELQAAFSGLLHPLLTITGCCQGVEVELDQDIMSFGAVVQRCQSSKKIVMMNAGDIGARFHWTTEHFPAELSIAPVKGYISPGMEVSFEVTFAPMELSEGTRYENLSCCVEGTSSPITLTVTGSCIAASTNKQVENFVCPVRSSKTHTLSVVNPTDQHCSIRPVIEGKQWSAELSVTFEPHQQKSFDITYRPLAMTTDGNKHQGSVFFSFPEGRGILYSLHGTAVSPEPEDIIRLKLPAKTNHCEVLSVSNWLPKQQWFTVLLEMVKPEKTNETVSLKGQKYVEVPALSKKNYKMSFFAYKEDIYNTKVTFRNEATNEYLFYLIEFEVTAPGVLSTIQLETTVRHVASATLHVENPLTTVTIFTTECNCSNISVQSEHTVPGQSEGALSFKYLPLQPGESTTRLSLFSEDLGYFHYNLLLKALPPPPEKAVYFNTCLGSSHSILIRFINYCRSKTKYSCKTDCPDFIVDASVAAPPGLHSGSELSVEVCFEPHQLGQAKGQFSLTSEIGGEYIFPLLGMCLPPKAQGPFSIAAGQSVTIPFKNVFLQTTAFSFQVDNPCFSVNGVDSIPAMKTQNIVVSFKAPSGGSSGPWFGKLTIFSQRLEGHIKPCSWCFYLKGHQPPSS